MANEAMKIINEAYKNVFEGNIKQKACDKDAQYEKSKGTEQEDLNRVVEVGHSGVILPRNSSSNLVQQKEKRENKIPIVEKSASLVEEEEIVEGTKDLKLAVEGLYEAAKVPGRVLRGVSPIHLGP